MRIDQLASVLNNDMARCAWIEKVKYDYHVHGPEGPKIAIRNKSLLSLSLSHSLCLSKSLIISTEK